MKKQIILKIQNLFDAIFGKQQWYKLFWEKRYINQTTKAARCYFDSVSSQVDKIISLLSDKKSVDVYTGMIKFRKTRNWNDFPGYEENQYFPTEIIPAEYNKKLYGGGCFIDCGGYDGATSLDFINRSKGSYDKIVVFEPDPKCYERIEKNLNGKQNVCVIKKGVWDSDTILYFNSLGTGSSSFVQLNENDNTQNSIPVVTIDNCPECSDASFIKMDLEGSEWNALHGAENTIRKNQPILAICLYHSDEDMVRLPLYIHELMPKAKLYVRQHSKSTSETVLYAVVN